MITQISTKRKIALKAKIRDMMPHTYRYVSWLV